MLFSTLPSISPIHTLPVVPPAAVSLNIGSAIKDAQPGSGTEMEKANSIAIKRIVEKFEADQVQYNQDLQAASLKATEASKVIGEARKNKAIAITLLVANIITIVGVSLAAVLTGTWPIAFAATPFLIGLVPTSYYTDIFCNQVSHLDRDLNAPSQLAKPAMQQLPIYNPKKDLDLKQSRIDAQNALASMTLQQIAKSEWSNQDIVNYALLDRVTVIKSEKHPAFYAKCVQLIEGYRHIVKEHHNFLEAAEREFKLIKRELKSWKEKQDAYIQSQEWVYEQRQREMERNAVQQRQARRRGEHVPVYTTVGTTMGRLANSISRRELESLKLDVAENYGRKDSENRYWYQNTLAAIHTAFNQAIDNLNQQFNEAKITAA